ncbi:MAG: glycoside hydrolase family protein [Streptosporangiaceae bacterium]
MSPIARAGLLAGIGGCVALTAVVALRPAMLPTARGSRPAVTLAVASAAQAKVPAAAVPAASAAQKGVGAWAFRGSYPALVKSGVRWYYTWGPDHRGIGSPHGVAFVPMIWGAGSVTTAALREVRREGRYLLGFNEPDNAGQANMSVAQALQLWPRLMSTGMRLGSPAVASGAATKGGWLDQFMHGVAVHHDRVNFIAVHWYGGDFATRAAVGQLRAYLLAIHNRYHRPLWLTEFALIRFGATTVFPSPGQQAAFVTAATSMLRSLSYVQRYAWFALPASSGDGTAGLFKPGAIATTAGRAFERVRP